jgi:hypothetical protein
MGIRLHRRLGYGLTDLVVTNGFIDDPRIAVDRAGVAVLYDEDETTVGDYITWLDEHHPGSVEGVMARFESALRVHPELRPPHSLHDLLTWEPDGGDEHVLLLSPLWLPSWRRNDDTIDRIEAPDVRTHVRVLTNGPPPFDGAWVDTRTGELIANRHVALVYYQAAQSDYHSVNVLDDLAVELGFTDHAQAQTYITPLVPDGIRNLAEFLGIFTGPDVASSLRPMLYTWWN